MRSLAVVLITVLASLWAVLIQSFDPSTVTVNPLVNDQFVGEILGLDLQTLDDDGFDFLNRALLNYKIVVVRNQAHLTVEAQRAFSQKFGDLHVHLESASHHKGYNDVNLVSNIKGDDGKYIGLYGAHVEKYHTDLSWSTLPCKVTILKSEIRPEACGDTHFLNTVGAYQGLSPEQQTLYRGLLGRYCYLNHRNVSENGAADNLSAEEVERAKSCAVHPLITIHPITQQYNIYANPSHTHSVYFEQGATPEQEKQAQEWLQALYTHTAQPEYFYNHIWQDADVVIWDNRAVHHRATGCPDDQPRLLVRTTVNNDEPPVGDVKAKTATTPFVTHESLHSEL